MIPKALDDTSRVDIDALVANAVSEGRTLEYKRDLPGALSADKREFCYDVSAMANAGGGDILFGVDEDRDGDGKPTGRPRAVIGLGTANLGAEQLRMDQVLQSGIDPRIPTVRFKVVEGWDGGPVLVLRVGQSWVSPHMVTLEGVSRFYSRNSAGKYQLDVREIRSAFALAESVAERVRRFRDQRLARIIARETPVPVAEAATVVIHVVPAAPLDGSFVRSLDDTLNIDLQPLYGQRANLGRFNADGYVIEAVGNAGALEGYVQVFRDGAIEAVDVGLMRIAATRENRIPSVAFERNVIESLKRILAAEARIGSAPPLIIMVSLLGAAGYEMAVSDFPGIDSKTPIDRDYLVLPDVSAQDFETHADVTLRPALDALWQAAGFAESPNYDESGRWVGER